VARLSVSLASQLLQGGGGFQMSRSLEIR
jgi:hypothetical protein